MATGRRHLPSPPRLSYRDYREYAAELEEFLTRLYDSEADGIPPGFNDTVPHDVEVGSAGDAGTENAGWAAADHEHPVDSNTPSDLGTANAEGSAVTPSRSDHIHRVLMRVVGAAVEYLTQTFKLVAGDAVEVAETTTGVSPFTETQFAVGVVNPPMAKGNLWGHDGATQVVIPVSGTDGRVLTEDSTAVPGVAWKSLSLGPTKYTLTYTDFQVANLTKTLTLFSLTAGYTVEKIKVKHFVQFAGAGITDCKVKIGILGALDKYTPDYDIDTVPSDTEMQLNEMFFCEDQANPVDVTVTVTSAGANLDQLTGGGLWVWVWTSAAD